MIHYSASPTFLVRIKFNASSCHSENVKLSLKPEEAMYLKGQRVLDSPTLW